MAEIYAEAMRHLALKARGVVRDLNPRGEMKYMRIRAKRHEVLVAFGEQTFHIRSDIRMLLLEVCPKDACYLTHCSIARLARPTL